MSPLKSKFLPLALVVGLTVPGSGCACTPRDWEDAGRAAGQVAIIVLVIALEVAGSCAGCRCH